MRRSVFEHAVRWHERGYPVVLLGDYVDNGPRANDAGFLREIFAFCREAGAVPLIGNHDLAYLYPEREGFRQNGFEPDSLEALARVYDSARDLLRYAYFAEPYLLSHAGMSSAFLRLVQSRYHVSTDDLPGLVTYLNRERPEELHYQSAHNDGDDPFDGPLWLRLPQYRGALASHGVTQVVGHSSQAAIRMRHNLLMVDVRLPLILEW